MAVYGLLEAGGTKMVLALADEAGTLRERTVIPTETPAVTIPRMIDFFRAHPVDALGIASFGPVDLRRMSPSYGSITATPKPGWANTPILDAFKDALRVPVGFDTDVGAAALAEQRLGAARGLSSCVYVTVGTGVGAGIVLDGRVVHGLIHPETGHILLRPEAGDPSPDGFCPFHRGCLEGLASGPAIEKRWGRPARELPQEHPAWQLEAAYLAQMCHDLLMTLSPEKIVLGGGVMSNALLFPMIRERTAALLNGYLRAPAIDAGLEEVIVPPALWPDSGALGAWLLARDALAEAGRTVRA